MKKLFITLILLSIIIGFYAYRTLFLNNITHKNVSLTEISSIDSVSNVLKTNTSSIKSTPNTFLVFKKSFMDCEHIITEENIISENLVNKTKEDFKNLFSDWEIQDFSEDEIVFYKNFYGFCNEHYLLKDDNGLIAIYSLDTDNKEILQEITNISTEYLTETDKMNLKKGIQIFGNKNLYGALEDFE